MKGNLLVLSLLMAVAPGACSCPERGKTTPGQGTGTAQPPPTGTTTSLPGTTAPSLPDQQRELMREMTAHCDELKQRAGYIKLTDRAELLVKAAERISVERRPPAFAAAAKELVVKTKALLGTKQPREDYMAVVEACQSCHTQFSAAGLRRVASLRLRAQVRNK